MAYRPTAYFLQKSLLGLALGILCSAGHSQDFLLDACTINCTQNDATTAHWARHIQQQAPMWAHAGFTGLWLPKLPTNQFSTWNAVLVPLRANRLEPVAHLSVAAPSAEPEHLMSLYQQLYDRYRIRSFCLSGNPEPRWFATALKLAGAKKSPPLVAVADLGRSRSVQSMAAWLREVYDSLPKPHSAQAFPRVLDHPLREALRKACTQPSYDVRNIFSASLRDASVFTGFHAVTYVNASFLPPGDSIARPMLAYAWLLTNNQLGLPLVALQDYQQPEYQEAINQLLKIHKRYIFNSTQVEYLNRPDTGLRSLYLSAAQGIDEHRVLLFQLDGRNTPAGKATQGASRDVLVAINFGDAPLKVWHEINTSNLHPSDRFYDVTGLSNTPELSLESGKVQGMEQAIYLEVPARSYAVWVQGETELLIPGEIHLNARRTGAAVELSWDALAEPGIRFFEMERSVNGAPFQLLTRVPVLAQATEAAYLYLDEALDKGKRYAYRVKAVKDSTWFASPVVQVEIPADRLYFKIWAGANPGERVLYIRSNVSGQAQLRILDKTGTIVRRENFGIQKGEARQLLPTAQLSPGLYLIDVRMNNERIFSGRMVLTPHRQ